MQAMIKKLIRVVIAIAVLGILMVVVCNMLGVLPFKPVPETRTVSPPASVNPALHGARGSLPPQVGLARGELAPDFALQTLDGQRVSLSRYRGKPVLLNFWMINCDGCQVEMPAMQRLYQREQQVHKDLVILAVNIVDGPDSIQQFVQQYGLTYPIVRDAQATVSALYTLRGTPTSFFLDRQGIIRAVVNGALDDGALQLQVQTIVA
jgi:Peroxiredoxin